jgi:hypothetical protein
MSINAIRWFWMFVLISVILVAGFGRCAMAECLSSAAQVRAEHGATAWSTWRYVGGHKCYMVGERKVMTNAGQRGGTSRVSKLLPTIDARPRSAAAPAVAEIIEAVRETAVSVDISIEPVTVTCDDNCLRLWESFDMLASMERLMPYRVRAAARDEAYTLWLSQR